MYTMVRPLIHYSLHLLAPFLICLLFPKGRRLKAAWLMLSTMAIDLDHLLADPVFDPNRMSVGFHPLHSYYVIPLYVLLCILPYARLHWPWWLRPIGIGLTMHILTDWQDFVLWH